MVVVAVTIFLSYYDDNGGVTVEMMEGRKERRVASGAVMAVAVMEMVSVEMVEGRNKSGEIITCDERRGILTSFGGLYLLCLCTKGLPATDSSKPHQETG